MQKNISPFSKTSCSAKENYLPTPCQTYLLQAALLPNDTGRSAFDIWSQTIGIDDLSLAEQRLLPLLYENLKKLSIDTPHLTKMKGVSRYVWSKNHARFHQLKPLFSLLKQHEIPFVLLKGAALLQKTYAHYGLRDMEDVDLLIRKEDAIKCLEMLRAHHWHSPMHKFRAIQKFSPLFTQLFPALSLQNYEEIQLDLHWEIAKFERPILGLAEEFLADAAPTGAFFIPSSEHLLLHVLHHAVEKNRYPTIRWVADAVILIRTSPHLSYEKLFSLTKTYHLEAEIFYLLDYLQQHFEMKVPLLNFKTSYPKDFAPPTPQHPLKFFYRLYRKIDYPHSFLIFLMDFFGIQTYWGLSLFFFNYVYRKIRALKGCFSDSKNLSASSPKIRQYKA